MYTQDDMHVHVTCMEHAQEHTGCSRQTGDTRHTPCAHSAVAAFSSVPRPRPEDVQCQQYMYVHACNMHVVTHYDTSVPGTRHYLVVVKLQTLYATLYTICVMILYTQQVCPLPCGQEERPLADLILHQSLLRERGREKG